MRHARRDVKVHERDVLLPESSFISLVLVVGVVRNVNRGTACNSSNWWDPLWKISKAVAPHDTKCFFYRARDSPETSLKHDSEKAIRSVR